MRIAAAKILLFISLVCFASASYLIFKKYRNQNVVFDDKTIAQTISNQSIKRPVFIKIRTLGISLPIIESEIVGNKWETTDKGVSFLKNSPIPGQIGNSILYGHNFPGLLGNLKKIQRGNEIEIVFDDNSSQKFVVRDFTTTKPENLHVLNQTKDRRITLYTCTGFLDSKRLIVTATPKKIDL